MSTRNIRYYYWYLSGKAKFLFIHIPKNAGVSIARSQELRGRILRPEPIFHVSREYSRSVRRAMKQTGDHHGLQHARLRDVSPKVRSHLQPFAVVRNPWARVVSRFTYAQKAMQEKAAPPGYAADTFEGFVEERHKWGGRDLFWHRAVRGWYPQVDYVLDENGHCPVHILRAEKLDSEATDYFKLAEPLGFLNVSNTKSDYRTFYTPETIQKIADWYKADIDYFGFDFDTPARKNTYFVDAPHAD